MRFALYALVLVGCGDGVDRDIEGQITIDQGVYGLLISGCDTSDCQDRPAAGEHVMVYSPGLNTVYATGMSDRSGVYQLDLEPGDYTLCTYACTPITVPASDRVRYDWTSGPGGGHWEAD
ncbi:MAG TPA: hypothetical protein VMZ53_09410 [Kofleriaceae bacterium]|nr:hypothetical protein [Kofleriaceae bacterium]